MWIAPWSDFINRTGSDFFMKNFIIRFFRMENDEKYLIIQKKFEIY